MAIVKRKDISITELGVFKEAERIVAENLKDHVVETYRGLPIGEVLQAMADEQYSADSRLRLIHDFVEINGGSSYLITQFGMIDPESLQEFLDTAPDPVTKRLGLLNRTLTLINQNGQPPNATDILQNRRKHGNKPRGTRQAS